MADNIELFDLNLIMLTKFLLRTNFMLGTNITLNFFTVDGLSSSSTERMLDPGP